MREVILAYRDAGPGSVARYDEFIAKFMRGGILAYFGVACAQEDDADGGRFCRAPESSLTSRSGSGETQVIR
jgi:hypothetical protein